MTQTAEDSRNSELYINGSRFISDDNMDCRLAINYLISIKLFLQWINRTFFGHPDRNDGPVMPIHQAMRAYHELQETIFQLEEDITKSEEGFKLGE